MKILFFIHSLQAGGAERVTATLANHWVRRGFTVTIVTLIDAEQDFYTLDKRIQRIELRLDQESNSLVEGFTNNLRRIIALRRVLQTKRPNVAIGMMTAANCILAIAAKNTGIVVIGSERTYPPRFPLGRTWTWIRKITYPFLSCLIAQTEDSATSLRHRIRAKKLRVIPNPVSFPLRKQSPMVEPPDTSYKSRLKILLAVGRLVDYKGFNRLLIAFSSLKHRFPKWRLVILGEGRDRKLLTDLAHELCIEERVFMPGIVGNIDEWYSAADLYVMTSLFEGFPNTLLEALAYGLPSVCVDCESGPREILRHEIDGLLVPQDDHLSLVEALGMLMADDNLRSSYATRAVETRKRFAIERISGMWERVFADFHLL